MKKLLPSIGATLIGTLGLWCCKVWMENYELSLTRMISLLGVIIIVARPTFDYWYEKLNK